MFTIFEGKNEPLTERAKVDELLSKVHATTLSAAFAQLCYQLKTVGVTIQWWPIVLFQSFPTL